MDTSVAAVGTSARSGEQSEIGTISESGRQLLDAVGSILLTIIESGNLCSALAPTWLLDSSDRAEIETDLTNRIKDRTTEAIIQRYRSEDDTVMQSVDAAQ